MKKILLLAVLLVFVFAAEAQSSRSGMENLQMKNSQIASVNSTDGFIENITVYPNPVVDLLKISLKSNQKCVALISLFNNIGKMVYSQESTVEQGNNLFYIDIQSKAIEPGIYFVQCIAGNETFTRKLIVK
jgi:hypothetical protein